MNCDIIKIAELFSAKICLLTSFRYACLVEIIPRDATPTRELWLIFWCEVYYNSLYAIEVGLLDT
ncbi:hypothetical protein PVAP13_2KG528800 [Panicum virgatum]|uniref:Uncharacterized protein n=1 Tax=Panicum virgatum TaxID=38727 RepID=A0A8T0WFQ5_PANVG|nr:hypothetical protein PVAP13_2KG528800 [Panicum virgatum]